MKKKGIVLTDKGIKRKERIKKMNSQIYDEYKQSLIDKIILIGKKELNKKSVSQLEIVLKDIERKKN